MTEGARFFKNLARYVVGGILGAALVFLLLASWINNEAKNYPKKETTKITNYLNTEQSKHNLNCATLRNDLADFIQTRLKPAYYELKKKPAFHFSDEIKNETEKLRNRVPECRRLHTIARNRNINSFPDLAYIDVIFSDFSLIATAITYDLCSPRCAEGQMLAFFNSYDRLHDAIGNKINHL